jgi:hypothetical protein
MLPVNRTRYHVAYLYNHNYRIIIFEACSDAGWRIEPVRVFDKIIYKSHMQSVFFADWLRFIRIIISNVGDSVGKVANRLVLGCRMYEVVRYHIVVVVYLIWTFFHYYIEKES